MATHERPRRCVGRVRRRPLQPAPAGASSPTRHARLPIDDWRGVTWLHPGTNSDGGLRRCYRRRPWTSTAQAQSSRVEHRASVRRPARRSPRGRQGRGRGPRRRRRARPSPTRSVARFAKSTSPTPTRSSPRSRRPRAWARCGCLVNCAGIGWAQRTIGKDGQYDSAARPRRLQEGHRHQPDRHLRLHPHRRHGDVRRTSRSTTASVAPSSTSPRSPPSTARSARPRTPRPRAASSA